MELQYNLLPALRQSPDLLAFLPSEFSSPFRKQELEMTPHLHLVQEKNRVIEKARSMGIPVAVIHGGSLPFLLFGLE